MFFYHKKNPASLAILSAGAFSQSEARQTGKSHWIFAVMDCVFQGTWQEAPGGVL